MSFVDKSINDRIKELEEQLKEAHAAIRWMTDNVEDTIAQNAFYGWDHADKYEDHKPAIELAINPYGLTYDIKDK